MKNYLRYSSRLPSFPAHPLDCINYLMFSSRCIDRGTGRRKGQHKKSIHKCGWWWCDVFVSVSFERWFYLFSLWSNGKWDRGRANRFFPLRLLFFSVHLPSFKNAAQDSALSGILWGIFVVRSCSLIFHKNECMLWKYFGAVLVDDGVLSDNDYQLEWWAISRLQ